MVMSKVFKTIAASFLCLTINVGYNVTNAMESNGISINSCNNFNDNIERNQCNNFRHKKSDFFSDNNKSSTKGEDDQNIDNQDKDAEDENGQDKGGKSKNVWRWLIGLIAVVGGLPVGFCLGKFVF